MMGKLGDTRKVNASEVICVFVKPNSKKGPLIETNEQDQLTVYVPQPAIDGKANQAVVALLAKHFGVSRSKVELISGAGARMKRFRITF